MLAYDLALVDYEELQEAGPGGTGISAPSSSTPTATPAAAAAPAVATGTVRPSTLIGIPGF